MICNFFGVLMMAVGMVVGLSVAWVLGQISPQANWPNVVGGLLGVSIPTIWDFCYRRKNHLEVGKFRYIDPLTGGQFFFIPVWLLFALGVIAGQVIMFYERQFGQK